MIPLRDNIPSRRTPVVMVFLIVTNVVVFLHELRLTDRQLEAFFYEYAFVPARVLQLLTGEVLVVESRFVSREPRLVLEPDPRTGAARLRIAPGADQITIHPSWRETLRSVLTMMFLHGGPIHLIGNMWYLWIFGDNIEDRLGHFRFLLLYLVGGVLATATQCFLVLTMSPTDALIPTLGASGAVAAVLGAYLVTYPFARILTLVPIFIFITWIELPAIFVLGAWFLMQLLSGAASLGVEFASGGVAWWAHVGGFLAGIVLVHLFAPQRPRPRGPLPTIVYE